MRFRIQMMAIVAACLGVIGQIRALDIVKEGKAAATIVVPDDPGAVAPQAAAWLQEYLRKTTGAELKIVPEKENPTGTLISVGATKLAENAGIKADDLKWDGCKLVVKGNALYLIGHDTLSTIETDVIWQGKPSKCKQNVGAQGTGKAVTTFLEKFCGVRWFLPAPEGELVPPAKDICVPDDLAMTVVPCFAFCHGRYLYGNKNPAEIANNCRTAVKLRSYGGHSWNAWVPNEVYYDKHPEYYALVNGKRINGGENAHLCTSNPEVRQILLSEIRKLFDAGYDWVQLGPSDGWIRCECPECEKLDTYRGRWNDLGISIEDYVYKYLKDNPAERINLLHKWISDECLKSHPGKTVHLLVYSTTIMPSKKFDVYPANNVGEMCDQDRRVVEAWKGKIPAKTAYVCWFDVPWHGMGMGVRMTPRQISERVRFLHENDFIGLYLGGGGACWGLLGPTYYTLGKMLGDPRLKYQDLTEEYCRGVFGKAADRMIDFFNLLYTREDDTVVENYYKPDRFGPGDRFVAMYPPKLLDRLDKMLQLAEADADTDRAKNWVKLTRDHFDFIRHIVFMTIAYRAYEIHPTPANLDEVKMQVDNFEAFRSKIIGYDDAYAAKWFPGYMQLYTFLTSEGDNEGYRRYKRQNKEREARGFRGTPIGYIHNLIREPLTLDFEHLKKMSDAKGKKSAIEVAPVAAKPSLDGLVREDEWRAAVPQTMQSIMRTSDVGTKVRMMYDDACLYIAYECDEPEIATLKTTETGRDGRVYDLDCVETFLEVGPSTGRYYQFIAAPSKDAFYDSQVGFKGMGEQDASWNGDWSYGFQVNKETKRWSLVMAIPFKTLGVEPPKSGTTWRGNFGRERRAGQGLDLYLWSPSDTGGFQDPLAFGEIRFK